MVTLKTYVILNPLASRAESWEQIKSIPDKRADVTVGETLKKGDASKLAVRAVEDGYDLIVAAGGDGTVNEVVNGLAPLSSEAVLGVLPLGTGNDFTRSLGLPFDPVDAWDTIQEHNVRTLDIVEASREDTQRYLINVASGGLSGEIGREISSELKSTWGSLAYVMSAVQLALEISPYQAVLIDSEGRREECETVNVFIANCSWTGGGMEVAPAADPTDGMFDVVTIGWDSTWDVVTALPTALQGSIHDTDIVGRRTVTALSVESHPAMPFNVDGEPFAELPITFRVVPQALRVLVGSECQF